MVKFKFFYIERFYTSLDCGSWFFPFFGRVVQKNITLFCRFICSQTLFNNHMTAVMLKVLPSFFTNHSKTAFSSATTDERNIQTKEYYIAHHDDKMCFLPICRYHNILTGVNRELLQKNGRILLQLPPRRLSIYTFQVSIQGRDCCRQRSICWKYTEGSSFSSNKSDKWKVCQDSRENRILRRNFRNHLLSSFRKTISTQTKELVFADRIEKLKNLKSI